MASIRKDPFPPPEAAFRASAAVSVRSAADLLQRLGLRGELPSGPERAPATLTVALPQAPFELWAFRAGLKPVVFLTVAAADVEHTVRWFGEVHCEQRQRRVQVVAQDRWIDRRDEGEAQVELYIARDAELARRAAQLQAEGDPSAALREIGALVGYPPCCVDAFARQDDRSNNSRNRYFTAARTPAPPPAGWPWQLNNLQIMIVPFYPCSYRCGRALGWASMCLEEMAREHAAVVHELQQALARPVLYFDHEHQLVFDGAADEQEIRYRKLWLWRYDSPPLAAFAAAIALGNRLRLDARQLLVARDGETVLRLERDDPGLGFIAPFGTD